MMRLNDAGNDCYCLRVVAAAARPTAVVCAGPAHQSSSLFARRTHYGPWLPHKRRFPRRSEYLSRWLALSGIG